MKTQKGNIGINCDGYHIKWNTFKKCNRCKDRTPKAYKKCKQKSERVIKTREKKSESAKTPAPKFRKPSWDVLKIKKGEDGNWVPLKQQLIQVYGVDAAVYFLHCMEVCIILGNQNKLVHGEWFYWEHRNVKRVLGFTEDQIRLSKDLIINGICGEKRNKRKIRRAKYTVLDRANMKGKEHFKIKWDIVEKIISEVTPAPLLREYRTIRISYDEIR